jgi:hypothetical protein
VGGAVIFGRDPEQEAARGCMRGVLFIVVGIGLVAYLIVDQLRASGQRALLQSGARVEGNVISLRVEKGRRGTEIYRLSYAYSVAGRGYVVNDRAVGGLHIPERNLSNLFEDPWKGRPITVWYDRSDPSRCVTEAELQIARHGMQPYLVGLIIVFGIVLSVLVIRRVFRRPLNTP